MANEKNLKRFGKEKPTSSREEAVKNGRKGGKASAAAKAKAKTTREIVEMLDSLDVTGVNHDTLAALGVPDDMMTQQTLRIAALHKKAISGDVAAVRLLLEIKGEAPSTAVKLEVNEDARAAYERAAALIKDTGK